MIRLIAVGKMKDPRYAALVEQYVKRIRPWAGFEIVELKDQGPDREAGAMIDRLGQSEHVVAMDEHGAGRTSRELGSLLARHGSPTFLIGGPDGLGDAVRARADLTLSLSPMTFPHELARLMLVEQIYRGLAINRGHAYHRD